MTYWREKKIRVDGQGDGNFAARRAGGSRTHEGVDYEFSEGEEVVIPFDAKVVRLGWAYVNSPYRLIELISHSNKMLWRFLYVKPTVEAGQKVKAGQTIGTAQAISKKYGGGMKDHVHVEVNVDPVAILGGSNGREE